MKFIDKKQKDYTEYTYNDIFYVDGNKKSINAKAYKKVRLLLNIGVCKHPVIFFVLVSLWFIISLIVFIFINAYVKYLKVKGIFVFILICIILCYTPILKIYLNNSIEYISKKSGFNTVNRYDLFINVFIKKYNRCITESNLKFDYLLIKKYAENEMSRIDFIKNILLIISGVIVGFYLDTPLNLIKEFNNNTLSIICLLIYIIVSLMFYYVIEKYCLLFSDRNSYILEMYETLIIYHNDKKKFINHYNSIL